MALECRNLGVAVASNAHQHQCPYCKKIYTCTGNCFTTRINNMICSECRVKWEKEMVEIKSQGTLWHKDIHF